MYNTRKDYLTHRHSVMLNLVRLGHVCVFHTTLCKELRRHLIDDEDWDMTLSMAQLRYNLTCHAATGMTPYRAIFGSNAFEFDCCLLARFRADDDPLAARLKEVHAQLLERGVKSRDRATRAYDRAVDEVEFAAGGRVLV
jgi:hypothetical protein